MKTDLQHKHVFLAPYAQRLLRDWNKDEDKFVRESKNKQLLAVGFEHWKVLLAAYRDHCSERKILPSSLLNKMFSLHRGTFSKWQTGENVGDLGHFFGVCTLILRRGLNTLPFQDAAVVIHHATRRRLAQLRLELDGLPYDTDAPHPSPLEISALEMFFCHRKCELAIGDDTPNDQRAQATSTIARDIYSMLTKITQDPGHLKSPQAVSASIRRWGAPYALFRFGMLPAWPEKYSEEAEE